MIASLPADHNPSATVCCSTMRPRTTGLLLSICSTIHSIDVLRQTSCPGVSHWKVEECTT